MPVDTNAAYVIVEPYPPWEFLSDLAREAVGKLQHDCPGQIEEVWRDDSEQATVYRVRQVKSVKGTPLSLG